MGSMSDVRKEKDALGEYEVPADAYYGIATARARDNFAISGRGLPRSFIQALGVIKASAAKANRDIELLEPEVSDAIAAASMEVAAGRWDAEFVVDVFQTGSGTSTNMNANEVSCIVPHRHHDHTEPETRVCHHSRRVSLEASLQVD